MAKVVLEDIKRLNITSVFKSLIVFYFIRALIPYLEGTTMRFFQLTLLYFLTQLYFTNAAVESCLDLRKSGVMTNGYYKVEVKGVMWRVYCDFTSEPDSAWTLVMSWSFENAKTPAFRSKSLIEDAPVNERIPNWDVYRMSKEHMINLKGKSSHWRVTCSFDTIKIGYKEDMRMDYRDYMRGQFSDFDITSYQGGASCKKVEYINVRGHGGHETAPFWQHTSHNLLHTDSASTGCKFNAKSGSKSSEDNFGYYGATNPKFRCTSGPKATTQYWFGGYVQI